MMKYLMIIIIIVVYDNVKSYPQGYPGLPMTSKYSWVDLRPQLVCIGSNFGLEPIILNIN